MSQQQDLRTEITNLPARETTAALQEKLEAAGSKTNLSLVAAGSISEAFVSAISPLLDRPIGSFTVDQIRDILAKVEARNASRGTEVTAEEVTAKEVTAETILRGFRKFEDGISGLTLPVGMSTEELGRRPNIALTLPVGMTIQEAGKLLNAAAKEKGMTYPVFAEASADFWAKNEADPELQTKPGQTYRFKIPSHSLDMKRVEQEAKYGNRGAPLGALAIAEACERLNQGTLFPRVDRSMGTTEKAWVRGSAPGVALRFYEKHGVCVRGFADDSNSDVAFASLVLSED